MSAGGGMNVGFVAVYVCWLGVCGIFLYFGITGIETANEWRDEATKETCFIIGRYRDDCTYDCRCTTDADGDEDCSTCWGDEYQYDALVIDKCGNQTISTVGPSTCDPPTIYDTDKEYTCYVLDCHEEQFIFEHPDESLVGSIIGVVLVSICAFVPGCCFYAFVSWCG